MRYDGAKLKAARLAAGLNQRELAKDAGISHATLYRIETGKSASPHPHTMRRLSRQLGVELRELMIGGES